MDSDTHRPFFGFNCLFLYYIMLCWNFWWHLTICLIALFKYGKYPLLTLLFCKSLLHSLHFNCRNIFSYVNNMLHVLLGGRAFIKSLWLFPCVFNFMMYQPKHCGVANPCKNASGCYFNTKVVLRWRCWTMNKLPMGSGYQVMCLVSPLPWTKEGILLCMKVSWCSNGGTLRLRLIFQSGTTFC